MEPNCKILVVDDSPFIYKTIRKALEPEGFKVMDQAFNGKECLQRLTIETPDLIITDITMPVMDGLELAENLLRKKAYKIIMISAMGDEELIKKAKRIGVQHFINKPFKTEELVSAVRSLL